MRLIALSCATQDHSKRGHSNAVPLFLYQAAWREARLDGSRSTQRKGRKEDPHSRAKSTFSFANRAKTSRPFAVKVE